MHWIKECNTMNHIDTPTFGYEIIDMWNVSKDVKANIHNCIVA